MSTETPLSLPPSEVRMVNAKGKVMSDIISMLCELAVVGGAIYLRSTGALSEDHFMVVAAAALVGPTVSRVRGEKAKATVTTLGLAFLAARKITLF